MTDSLEAWEEALAGAPEIPPSQFLRYMGTDIHLQGTPTAPRNLPEVRAAIWKQLRPQQLSPDAAMMVLMAKLPSKLLPRTASIALWPKYMRPMTPLCSGDTST